MSDPAEEARDALLACPPVAAAARGSVPEDDEDAPKALEPAELAPAPAKAALESAAEESLENPVSDADSPTALPVSSALGDGDASVFRLRCAKA